MHIDIFLNEIIVFPIFALQLKPYIIYSLHVSGAVSDYVFTGTVSDDVFTGTVSDDVFTGTVSDDVFTGTVSDDVFSGTVSASTPLSTQDLYSL